MSGGQGAELIADGGAAAASDDLFRHPAYLAAEGVTHTLRLEGADRVTLVPVIVREVTGSEHRDAISPYAYPGATAQGAGGPPDPAEFEWSQTGLVSVFIRDHLGAHSLLGGLERSRVQVHDPRRPREIRPRLAEQVRATARAGWSVGSIPGPRVSTEELDGFALAYEQTMRRTGAAARYFFGQEYFEAVLGHPRSWLLVARGPEGEFGAAAIAGLSDGFLHYFLGGTAEECLDDSPFKNVVVGMLDLADELGLPLNLGGGVRPGDGLERFKRGFANTDLPFITHEIVCDPQEYERLSAGRDAGGFFPAYRAP